MIGRSLRLLATNSKMLAGGLPRSRLGLLLPLRRSFSRKPEDFIQDFDPSGGKAQGKEVPGAGPRGEEDPLLKNPLEEDENSFYSTKKSSIYMLLGASGAMIALYFLMIINTTAKEKAQSKRNSVTHVGRANIGGPWELQDLNGKPFGSRDLDGRYYLIYFGFCRCPDVCPQSLHKMTKALEMIRKAPEKKYFDLEFVFVTVDPDRDDKQAVQNFLKHFDKAIIPVTARANNDPALKQMMSRFKIHASKIELEDEQADPSKPRPYTIDHTIITYLMDDENTYLTHIGSNMSASETAQHIITKIITNRKEKLIK